MATRDTRRENTRRAVRRAVVGLLSEGDYSHLTFERISARSGVARTTLYRHWPTRAELVFDLVLRERELPSLAETGSAVGDVEALAQRAVAFVGGPLARQVFPGIIADITGDAELLARFTKEFVAAAQPLVEASAGRIAAARGWTEPRSAEDLQAILIGAAFMWVHIGVLDHEDAVGRVRNLIDALYPPQK